MVSPLMQLAIFWLVFGFILKNGYPNFVVFLFAGLIAWNFFSGALITSTGIIVERAGIVKKVAFPREILALSTVGAQIFYFSMQAVAMAVILIVLQAVARLGARVAPRAGDGGAARSWPPGSACCSRRST